MKRFSFPCFLLQGVFLCFCIFSVSAQNIPEDAPVLISQPGSTRALTATRSGKRFDFSASVIQVNRTSRITFFVTNLELVEGEGASAFRVDAQDARGFRYRMPVLAFEPTADRPWVYALTVSVHPAMENVGDVLVRVNWRGVASNRARVAMGFESKEPADDSGAMPTPMPDKPLNRENFAGNLGLPWSGDLVRFMEQATFGPNAALEERLRNIGFSAWLGEQMEEKRDASGALRYSTFPYPVLALQTDTPSTACTGNCLRDNYSMYPMQRWFFREALYGEDQQLRRRVSWALSQIWVVSGRETVQPSRMVPYVNVLDKHAFGNYRQLMEEMTLNPAMGNYLDMAISTKTSPNENYAREILQLFSIGLFMLNQDGTIQRDSSGAPLPTYSQTEVNGFTKVFTGWTFCGQGCPNSQPGIRNFRDPMILTAANHDTTEKQILRYSGSVSIIPAGLTADQDLQMALDNIFYHPNVAPFVGKILIGQLVTSNPTPAFVGRVSAVFNDNGQGIRGDLGAVVRAILTDPEARGNLKTDPDYGHLREPVQFVTNILRPHKTTANTNPAGSCNNQSDGVLNGITLTLDQDVFNPPSVFNYYPLDYTLQNTDLSAPEFGIFSTGTALKRPNFVNQMVFGNGITTTADAPCGTKIDLTRWQSLASADTSGAQLVDMMNTEILHGSMSPQVRNHILTAVQAVAPTDSLKRARTALYLVTTSAQFQVQR